MIHQQNKQDFQSTNQCITCHQIKPIEEFIFVKHTGKYRNECKLCRFAYEKNWQKNHIIVVKEINIGQSKKCVKCFESKLISEFSFRKDSGKFNNTCKNCKSQRSTIWIKNNREKFNTRENNRKKERRKNDPEFSFKLTVSSSIDKMFRKNSKNKNNVSVWTHLPWSYTQIIDFFEKIYFTLPENNWMHRNNRGKYIYENWDDNDPSTWAWHIDHIIPHSVFQYDTYSHPDFTKCWDIKNLRPLRADQNISENNRRNEDEIHNLRNLLDHRLKELNYNF